ncbi:MAG: succinate--CoA ligase subunit alpha [Bacillota bacterium]
MSIIIDKDTKIIVQGITGREGSFHADLMLKYGANVVGGVTPGKSDKKVHGLPVFDTVKEAAEATGADASILFVPPRFSRDAILEAVDAGLEIVVTVAEGIPFHDMVYCREYANKNDCTLIGPNTPGIISPGKSKLGFMADIIYKEGSVGMISRSATLSYEAVNNLTTSGIGQSTVVGIGGDPVQGVTFKDLLPMFEEDPETEVVVMIGEIGGTDEEEAALYVKEHMKTPVIAFIAGEAAPEGKRMGHAGAIVSPGGEGSADYKKEKLEEAGIEVARKLTDIPALCKKYTD